jgi:gliding motility-associated-like protein
MKRRSCLLIFSLLFALLPYPALAQKGPAVWVFGKNAGLNFNTAPPTVASYPIDNCYSPSASQCDVGGNLLFYCDGRDIKDKNGQVMAGSLNPVWQAPVHIARRIVSNIIPVTHDTNRYYVFTLSPSSGEPPFGTYYAGVLTYSIVDMRLNNGNGGIDPAFSNVLLNTELDVDMIAVPGRDCNYWLITYKRSGNPAGKFTVYSISDQGISDPVYSSISLAGFPYPFSNMEMVYAYQYHKIVAWIGGRILFMMAFDNATGMVSNGKILQDLVEFRSPGGGVNTPSVCLSPGEKFLYVLGYPHVGTGPNGPGILLRQYPVDFTNPNLNLPIAASSILFDSTDPLYQTPSTSVPYGSSNCDTRIGPDNKVYLFFNTAQSFLGVIHKPDNPGATSDLNPQGLQLQANTFGSFFFPAIENKPFTKTINYNRHDTLLCFMEPLTLVPRTGNDNYNYLWHDGSTTPVKQVTAAGTYWVKSTGDCDDATQIDTFIVAFEPPEKCYCTIFIPNAFSPNTDNLNDIFKPILPLTCMNGGFRMLIYNRWGENIFQNYDALKGWDGSINGQPADLGVYHYTIKYRDNKNKEQHYKGSFTLLR